VIIVVSGPGGVGKGTVVARLVERDPSLWLSRSWTTRAQRPGESADAYTFTDRATFERHVADDGFLEWAEFLGHLYGTPRPDLPEGHDLVLEIDVQGAAQVRDADPDALLVLLVAPSPEVQAARLRGRGDPEAEVTRRLAKAVDELEAGRSLGAIEVVNDELGATVDALATLIDAARSGSRPA
jgi:guanylate kinase